MKVYKIALFLLFMITFLSSVGFSNRNEEQYKVTYNNTEIILNCVVNEEGILLLPLKEMSNLLGLVSIDCGRCGKDEVYREGVEDTKGHLFVNWYKNVITYSNDPAVILLDATNEKIDGITYTSSNLYQYLGLSISVDNEDKSIEIIDDNDQDIDQDNSSNEVVSKDILEITDERLVYLYDPACSSCDEITKLIEQFCDENNLQLYMIDATKVDQNQEITKYEEAYKVPKEIRGIYPMVYFGGEFLFHAEITEYNLESLRDGNRVIHNIISGNTLQAMNTSEGMEQTDKVLIYFYSTTCASCKTAVDFINLVKNRYPELEVVGYNLYIADNISLLKAYGRKYKVKPEEVGEIPAVFLSDTALVGDNEIVERLEQSIANYNSKKPTLILDVQKVVLEKNLINGLAVFGAGVLNGINPCSLSMFLFLLSLMLIDPRKIIKIGFSFCFGKFLMFFLLGTIFYQFISIVDISVIQFITKDLLIVMIVMFAILNMYDFMMAKREKYDKMLLQLPSWLKGYNQRLLKKSTKYMDRKIVVILMIMIGMVLAFGEFMCTGQIYLTSIIVLIQGGGMDWLAILYLLIYSVAFVIPLIILTLLISFGKKVFGVSEGLLVKLPMIKVISSILFILFGIYVVLR